MTEEVKEEELITDDEDNDLVESDYGDEYDYDYGSDMADFDDDD